MLINSLSLKCFTSPLICVSSKTKNPIFFFNVFEFHNLFFEPKLLYLLGNFQILLKKPLYSQYGKAAGFIMYGIYATVGCTCSKWIKFEMVEVSREALLKVYYENCPGCRQDRINEERLGIPFKTFIFIWSVQLCTVSLLAFSHLVILHSSTCDEERDVNKKGRGRIQMSPYLFSYLSDPYVFSLITYSISSLGTNIKMILLCMVHIYIYMS